MAVAFIDLDAFAQTARRGRASEWLERHRAILGFGVSAEAFERLRRHVASPRGLEVGGPAMTLQHAFSAMLEAAQDEVGVSVAEVRREWGGKDVILAYRDETHLHVALAYSSSVTARIGQIWKGLSPWYRNLTRNRERLVAWSSDPAANSILSLPLAARARRAPTSARGTELLAVVLANPKDKAARLVYADWLVEQGDAQGHLIQVSEALWAMDPNDAQRRELQEEAFKLSQHFGARIAGEASRLAANYRLWRGFVDQVAMSAASFATHFERLLEQHPIRSLRLSPANAGALERLARTPALARLRGLELVRHSGASPLSLMPLFLSPHLTALEALDIFHWDAGEDAFSAFASLEAPRFKHLKLYKVTPIDDVMAGLAANASLKPQSLELQADQGFDGRAFLSPCFEQLRWLELRAPLDDDAAHAIARALHVRSSVSVYLVKASDHRRGRRCASSVV